MEYQGGAGHGNAGGYPKSKQVARCGNAVPPPFALALVLANWPERCRGAGFATMAALNEHIAV